jgi:hypothetical protein
MVSTTNILDIIEDGPQVFTDSNIFTNPDIVRCINNSGFGRIG